MPDNTGTNPGAGGENVTPGPASRLREPPAPAATPATPETHGPAAGRLSRGGNGSGARPGRRRPVLVWVALTLGLAGLVVCAAGAVVQILPRSFSASQRQQIMAWEVGKRWRVWPAGKIFPKVVPYRLTGSVLGGSASLTLTAHRIGIAPQAGCGAAADPGLARVLLRHGCLAVLRATYADATGALAVTVGVAVLPGTGAARASAARLAGGNGLGPGVRAVPFGHTLVAGFGDAQRQLTWDLPSGPYLVLATAGYADGRRRVQEAADPYAMDEMSSVADGIGRLVAAHLGAAPPVPKCPGAPAC